MKNWFKKVALSVLAGLMVGGAAFPVPPVIAAAPQKQERVTAAWHTYDDGAMTIQWKVEENKARDKIVSLVFKSKSTERFSLGWVDNPLFILTTKMGDFATKEMKPKLNAANRKFDLTPFRLQLTFRGAKGAVEALRITDIRPLDENGLPTLGIIDLTMDFETQE